MSQRPEQRVAELRKAQMPSACCFLQRQAVRASVASQARRSSDGGLPRPRRDSATVETVTAQESRPAESFEQPLPVIRGPEKWRWHSKGARTVCLYALPERDFVQQVLAVLELPPTEVPMQHGPCGLTELAALPSVLPETTGMRRRNFSQDSEFAARL
mmetsp:Transcript_135445/g.235557  ORF Transcript_135445/g.235557 Transcript_135445/m.235557 type:complete len:158 (+) Transcript_135445:177-650(+)